MGTEFYNLFLSTVSKSIDIGVSSLVFNVLKLQTGLDRTDYYEILQVPRNAGEEQIRKAYKKLAMKFHPVSKT